MFDLRLMEFEPMRRDETIGKEYELSRMDRGFVVKKINTIERLMQVIAIKVYDRLWNKHKLADTEFEALAHHTASLVESDFVKEQMSMEDIANYSDSEFLLSLTVLSIDLKNRNVLYDIKVRDQQTAFSVNFGRRK